MDFRVAVRETFNLRVPQTLKVVMRVFVTLSVLSIMITGMQAMYMISCLLCLGVAVIVSCHL